MNLLQQAFHHLREVEIPDGALGVMRQGQSNLQNLLSLLVLALLVEKVGIEVVRVTAIRRVCDSLLKILTGLAGISPAKREARHAIVKNAKAGRRARIQRFWVYFLR